MVKYVDDSTIWEVCASNCHGSQLQLATDQACACSNRNQMRINVNKTKSMMVNFSHHAQEAHPIMVAGVAIEQVATYQLLGCHHRRGSDMGCSRGPPA